MATPRTREHLFVGHSRAVGTHTTQQRYSSLGFGGQSSSAARASAGASSLTTCINLTALPARARVRADHTESARVRKQMRCTTLSAALESAQPCVTAGPRARVVRPLRCRPPIGMPAFSRSRRSMRVSASSAGRAAAAGAARLGSIRGRAAKPRRVYPPAPLGRRPFLLGRGSIVIVTASRW